MNCASRGTRHGCINTNGSRSLVLLLLLLLGFQQRRRYTEIMFEFVSSAKFGP